MLIFQGVFFFGGRIKVDANGCMGEFWRAFAWYFEVHVWVNFGGIFSYNCVHCLFGLVPFNDLFFAMVIFFPYFS